MKSSEIRNLFKNSRKLWITCLIALSLVSGSATIIYQKGKSGNSGTYQVDIENSRVFWRLDAHSGIIPILEGKLNFMNDNLSDAFIKVHMDSLRNLDIDYKLMRIVLENTIKSKEVFETQRYPYAYFRLYTSEMVAADSLHVTGDLEIKEIENCISFKTAVNFGQNQVKINTDTINIDRIRWGIIAMSKDFATGEEAYIISNNFQLQISLAGKAVQ
ncbi:hypothetical protein MASR1M74_05820 [Lentimicrobium sp.]